MNDPRDHPEDGSSPPQQGQRPNSNMSRRESIRQMQDSISKRRQALSSFVNNHREEVHDQIKRLNSDYSPPMWSPWRSTSHSTNLRMVEENVLVMCASAGRTLNDAEAKAASEVLLEAMHKTQLARMGTMAIAGLMAWRGRKIFRFPFYTPQFKSKFLQPNAAGRTSLIAWHSLRFAAYLLVVRLTVDPAIGGAMARSVSETMKNDERLRHIWQERNQHGFEMGASGDASSSSYSDSQAQSQYSSNTNGYESFTPDGYQQNRSSGESASWSPDSSTSSYPQATSSYTSTSETQQRSSSWDSNPNDDTFDDASPVAASSHRRKPASSGSSWDRIRQQAQTSRGGIQQESSSQEHQQRRQQSNTSWSSEGQSAQWGGEQGKGDYSKADGGRGETSSQAQKEFDRMLERERRAGQDKNIGSTW